jgi:MFS family permease
LGQISCLKSFYWIGAPILLESALRWSSDALAAVSDVAHPKWRASSIGVYRLWRDGGYAIGALISGVLADSLGIPFAMAAIAALTFLSGIIVALVMYETLPGRHPAALPQDTILSKSVTHE